MIFASVFGSRAFLWLMAFVNFVFAGFLIGEGFVAGQYVYFLFAPLNVASGIYTLHYLIKSRKD